jgi:hypothetical protein
MIPEIYKYLKEPEVYIKKSYKPPKIIKILAIVPPIV